MFSYQGETKDLRVELLYQWETLELATKKRQKSETSRSRTDHNGKILKTVSEQAPAQRFTGHFSRI
jgi:hypothetical protein